MLCLSRIACWKSHVSNSLNVCFVPQPKLTDEEGWKRFCLGDKVFLGTSSCDTDTEPEPALNFTKVVRMFLA